MFPEEDTKCFKKLLKLDPFVNQIQIFSRTQMLQTSDLRLFWMFLLRFNRLRRKVKNLKSFQLNQTICLI